MTLVFACKCSFCSCVCFFFLSAFAESKSMARLCVCRLKWNYIVSDLFRRRSYASLFVARAINYHPGTSTASECAPIGFWLTPFMVAGPLSFSLSLSRRSWKWAKCRPLKDKEITRIRCYWLSYVCIRNSNLKNNVFIRIVHTNEARFCVCRRTRKINTNKNPRIQRLRGVDEYRWSESMQLNHRHGVWVGCRASCVPFILHHRHGICSRIADIDEREFFLLPFPFLAFASVW